MLVARACDQRDNIQGEIVWYKESERKACQEFIQYMYDSTFIKLDAAGLNPTELCDVVAFRVKPKVDEPLRPLPIKIENGGDFKSLLTDDGDEEAGILPRQSQWSLWKQTDPVALKKGQVEEGLPEFAVHFANNVFVFKTEDNMNKFIENPREFIQTPPEMPASFRVLMLGPRGVGKRT
jgi:hypothetical protein